jgi:hypothetical protein
VAALVASTSIVVGAICDMSRHGAFDATVVDSVAS